MQKLWKQALLISCGVVVVFLGGVFGSQYLTERALADDTEITEISAEDWDQGEPSLADFYLVDLGYPSEVMTKFGEKFNVDVKQVTQSSLTSEQFDYLQALSQFYAYPEAPILTRNQLDIEDKNYLMSLEASSSDTMAMSPEDDSTGVIEAILDTHDIDYDGQVKDLSVEIILEINDALYEASSHPKE